MFCVLTCEAMIFKIFLVELLCLCLFNYSVIAERREYLAFAESLQKPGVDEKVEAALKALLGPSRVKTIRSRALNKVFFWRVTLGTEDVITVMQTADVSRHFASLKAC